MLPCDKPNSVKNNDDLDTDNRTNNNNDYHDYQFDPQFLEVIYIIIVAV
jgi:hypothetical protein